MAELTAVTGAYGYLGSLIRDALETAGCPTIALARHPRPGDNAVAWSLGDQLPVVAGDDVAALVHCAYDMTVRRPQDIWRVNVEGSAALLRSAADHGIERILVLSSMSAYEGTRQLYGRAKFDIEQLTLAVGGIAIRPGLVYGADAGGMAGTLAALTRLPVTPVLAGGARQFPVLEQELVQVIVDLIRTSEWKSEVFGVAQPTSVPFRRLLSGLATRQGVRCRMVPVPWRLVHAIVRIAERVVPSFGLRSDSVLGLVEPAMSVPPSAAYPGLLDSLTTFERWVATGPGRRDDFH